VNHLIEPEYELGSGQKQLLGGVLTIAAVVSLFAAGIVAYEMSRVYSKPQWGFRFQIPLDWEKGSERDAPGLVLNTIFLKNYANRDFGGMIAVAAFTVPENLKFENFVNETKTWYTENFESMRISVTTIADHPRLVSGVTGWEWTVNLSFENMIYFEKLQIVMLFSGGRSYTLTFEVFLVDMRTGASISDYLPLETDFDSLVNSFQLT
jgi:hypothetical protein